MNAKNWALLCLLSLIWAGAFLFAKVAVSEIPPLTLAFLRVALAAAVLHIALYMTGHRFNWSLGAMTPFLIMGLLNNAIPFSLLFWGQTQIAAGLAAILNATTPIFAFLIAGVWQKQEAIAMHRFLGVFAGFSGVALILSSGFSGLERSPVWAQIACLGAALSYGLAAAYAKRFKGTPPIVSATGQLTGSSILLLVPAIVFAGSWSPITTSAVAWANVIALGVIATAAAYLIYFRLLAQAGATNAALVTLLIPANTVLFGYLLLGEKLVAVQIAGFTCLLLGLLLLDGRVLRLPATQKHKA